MICGHCHATVRPSRMIRHWREKKCIFGDWKKVMELRRAGRDDAADRAARLLMGIKPEPMSEDAKARLKQYAIDHADEIKHRQEVKRLARRRTKDMMKKSAEKLTRRRR